MWMTKRDGTHIVAKGSASGSIDGKVSCKIHTVNGSKATATFHGRNSRGTISETGVARYRVSGAVTHYSGKIKTLSGTGQYSHWGLNPSAIWRPTCRPLIFAVAYGISMDYGVFLLTRIRERYDRSGDNWSSIVLGVASSAAPITIIVFAIFVATGVPFMQEIGLGIALAIAIDATLVRLILLPAATGLLGDLNWWLPRPIERLFGHSWSPADAAQGEGTK